MCGGVSGGEKDAIMRDCGCFRHDVFAVLVGASLLAAMAVVSLHHHRRRSSKLCGRRRAVEGFDVSDVVRFFQQLFAWLFSRSDSVTVAPAAPPSATVPATTAPVVAFSAPIPDTDTAAPGSLDTVRLGAGTGPVLLMETGVPVTNNALISLATYNTGKFYDVALRVWSSIGVGQIHATITLDGRANVGIDGELVVETIRGYPLPAYPFADYGPLSVRGGSTLRFQRMDALPGVYNMDVCVTEHVPFAQVSSGRLVLPPVGRWTSLGNAVNQFVVLDLVAGARYDLHGTQHSNTNAAMPFTVRALLGGTVIAVITQNDTQPHVAYGGWFRFGPLTFTSPVTGTGVLTFSDVTSPQTDNLINYGYTIVPTLRTH